VGAPPNSRLALRAWPPQTQQRLALKIKQDHSTFRQIGIEKYFVGPHTPRAHYGARSHFHRT